MPLKFGHHQPAIEMVFCWRVDNGLSLNASLVAFEIFKGSGTILLGNPIFCDFGGGGGGGQDPLLEPPM